MAAQTKSFPDLPLMLRLKLFIGSFLLRLCKRSDGTLNRRLFNLFDAKVPEKSTAIIGNKVVSSSDIPIDPSRGLWFRLFTPQTTINKLPLIVYFHGGGFTSFSPDSKACDDLCRVLAGKLPALVVSVNYRLAPEHKYPCQYEDGFDALKFINDQNNSILPDNADLTRCYLFGDSAGGNIAHHVILMALQSSKMLDKITLSGLVALQPFFGGEERTESELRLTKTPVIRADDADKLWKMFLPDGASRDHPAANVFGSRGDTEERVKCVEFPRSLVIVGGFDPLQDWQKRYAEGLEKCDKEVELVEYPNAFHGFYCFQELPEFDLCIQDVTKFIYHDG